MPRRFQECPEGPSKLRQTGRKAFAHSSFSSWLYVALPWQFVMWCGLMYISRFISRFEWCLPLFGSIPNIIRVTGSQYRPGRYLALRHQYHPPLLLCRSWQFNFLSQDTRHLDFKSIESAWFLLLILYIILALHLRFSGTLYVWLLDWEIHTKTQQKTLPILNFHKFSYLNKVDKSIWLVLGYSGIYIFKLSILFKHLVWLIHVRTDNPLSF